MSATVNSTAGFLWLASYPKSGNTWLRLLIQSALSGGAPVDINAITIGPVIAQNRPRFDQITGIAAADLTDQEILNWRPIVLRAIAAELDGPFFAKSHARQMALPNGDLLHPSDISLKAVVLVRDPCSIAPSLARHIGKSIDEAIEVMGTKDACRGRSFEKAHDLLVDPWGAWSEHVASWFETPGMPTHIIRYEDLRRAPQDTLRALFEFLGQAIPAEAIERAISNCDIALLRAQEMAAGFREWREPHSQFFGAESTSRQNVTLSPAQEARLTSDHGVWMKRLGYVR
jgi:aryl sulfotransferase